MRKDTMEEYLFWRGDLGFDQTPVCEVDGLAFSVLAYIDWSEVIGPMGGQEMTLHRAADILSRRPGGADLPLNDGEKYRLFLAKAGESRRFGDTVLCAYESLWDPEKETQFAAVTFRLPGGGLFVAFRGTDNTLIGWKEDINMCFSACVPSQQRAAEYLLEVMTLWPGETWLGGHSKGGNLAVWAAIHAPEQFRGRIREIYSNDGPGFSTPVLQTREYLTLASRIRVFVPRGSVVGTLFEQDAHYKTIQSFESGLMQHDPFSWAVAGPRFVVLEGRSPFSQAADLALRRWLEGMTQEERMELADILFRLMRAGNNTTTAEIRDSKARAMAAMARTMRNFDKETRRQMLGFVRRLLESGSRAVTQLVQGTGKEE